MSKILFYVFFSVLAVVSAAQPGRVYCSLEEVSDPALVYHLQLHGKRLKHVPAQVYEMVHLEVLDLRSNKINYLSDSLALLTNLQRLDVSRNPLREIPAAVAQLSQLKELVVWSTYVTSLPTEISCLNESLQVIDMRSCPLTYDDQQAIEQLLPSVKKLWNYACNCSE